MITVKSTTVDLRIGEYLATGNSGAQSCDRVTQGVDGGSTILPTAYVSANVSAGIAGHLT